MRANALSSYYEKFLATGEVKCIDEEIPFEIPNGWEWCRFSSIYWSLTDGAHSTPQYCESGVPFISVKDMSSGKLCFEKTKFISKAEHESLSVRCNPQRGDLLLSKVGTTGIPLIIDTDVEFSIFVSLALVKFPHHLIDPQFLTFLIESPLVQMQAQENTRGVGNKNWVLSAIANTLIVLPPFAEQKRILAKIHELQSFINKYNSAQCKLDKLNASINEQLKKSILQEAIQGKLVSQKSEEGTAEELLAEIRKEKERLVKDGKLKKFVLNDSTIFKSDDNKYYEQIGSEVVDITDDIPFEIPVNWMWIRLKDLCSIRTGATFKKEEASTEHKGIRVLRGGNIQRFLLSTKPDDLFISEGKVKYDILLKQNDIVTPAVTSLENIGKMARVEIDMPDTTVGGFVFIIRPFVKNDYVSKYLLAFMSSPTAVDYMQSITNKSGQAFYNIGKERLATTLVPLPPLTEQKRICSRISELFGKIKA